MSSSHTAYPPQPDTAPEAEKDALAAVYKFVLDCHSKKRGRPSTGDLDDATKGSKHDHRAKPDYTAR
jgi:hypothetical protein